MLVFFDLCLTDSKLTSTRFYSLQIDAITGIRDGLERKMRQRHVRAFPPLSELAFLVCD